VAINHSSLDSILGILHKQWSEHVKVVLIVVFIHILNKIWYSGNLLQLENLRRSYVRIKKLTYTYVNIAANRCSGRMHSIIEEFVILKAFVVDCHPKKAPKIPQVNWLPPPCYWQTVIQIEQLLILLLYQCGEKFSRL